MVGRLLAEGGGDGFGCNIVMGRADAAGGEDVIEFGAQRVHRGDDLFLNVRHDADFKQLNADLVQLFADEADIGVLGTARQDFIADHDHAGSDGGGFC